MDCISPPALDDIKLFNHLDGEVNDEVARHIKQCPYCDNNAKRLARLQNGLKARLYRIDCPAPDELGEYHLRLLEHDRVEIVRDHLGKCLLCQRELAQLEEFMYDEMPVPEISTMERIRVLVAHLSQGGARGIGQPAFAGVRGETDGPSYVYEAGDAQVSIEVQDDPEQPDRKILLGLIIGIESGEMKVQLWQAGQLVSAVVVDDFGNFVIPQLGSGSYELVVSGAEVEIHVQDLEV